MACTCWSATSGGLLETWTGCFHTSQTWPLAASRRCSAKLWLLLSMTGQQTWVRLHALRPSMPLSVAWTRAVPAQPVPPCLRAGPQAQPASLSSPLPAGPGQTCTRLGLNTGLHDQQQPAGGVPGRGAPQQSLHVLCLPLQHQVAVLQRGLRLPQAQACHGPIVASRGGCAAGCWGQLDGLRVVLDCLPRRADSAAACSQVVQGAAAHTPPKSRHAQRRHCRCPWPARPAAWAGRAALAPAGRPGPSGAPPAACARSGRLPP